MSEHLPEPVLRKQFDEAVKRVSVGSHYRHYKRQFYVVEGVAIREATNEVMVIYRADYGEYLTFVRPLAEWLEAVEWQGQQVPRFILIDT